MFERFRKRLNRLRQTQQENREAQRRNREAITPIVQHLQAAVNQPHPGQTPAQQRRTERFSNVLNTVAGGLARNSLDGPRRPSPQGSQSSLSRQTLQDVTDDDLKTLWLGYKSKEDTSATLRDFEKHLQEQKGVGLSENQRQIITIALAKDAQQALGPRKAGLPSRPTSGPNNHVRVGPRGLQSSGCEGPKPGTLPPPPAKPHRNRDLRQGGLNASLLDPISSTSNDSGDAGTERLKQILDASFKTEMTLNDAVKEVNMDHRLRLSPKEVSLVRDYLQSMKLLLPPDMN